MRKYFQIFCLLFCLTGCFWQQAGTSANTDITFIQARTLVEITTPGGDRLQFHMYVADQALEHQQGLGAVEDLAVDEGMIFIFSQPSQPTYWMKDVEYPIDIVWVNNGVVIGITESVQPEDMTTPLSEYARYDSPGPVTEVVELPAGTVTKQGIYHGATINIIAE